MGGSVGRVYAYEAMNSNPTSTSSSSSSVSPDAISRRAYELWEQEGKPEGGDLRHWLQAEQELGVFSHSGSQSNGAATARTSEGITAKNTGTDARPLQGTRAAAAANRDKKSSASTSPFGERAAPSGGQTAGAKRR
jgi:hypothetical protein